MPQKTSVHLLRGLTALFVAAPLPAASAAAVSNRPNIVFFLADDLRQRDIGAYMQAGYCAARVSKVHPMGVPTGIDEDSGRDHNGAARGPKAGEEKE